MEKDRIIHDFLDGSLSNEKEAELFYSLSSDDELRMELKEQLAIKNAIKGDLKAKTPKVASTMAIFSELGFTPPPVANIPNTGSAVTSPLSKVAAVLSKYTGFIATGITAALTTAVVMLMLLEPEIFSNSDLASVSKDKITVSEQNDNQNNNNQNQIPVISSEEDTKQESVATADNKETVVYKYIYITKEKPEAKDVAQVESIVKQLHQSEPASRSLPSAIESKVVFPIYQSPVSNTIVGAYRFDKTEEISSSNYGIVIEFRSAKDWTNSNGLNPASYQDWNNISLGLFKSVNEEFMLGVEYRRENFYLDFKGIEGENDMYKYEVYPNLSSLTAAVRYSPDFMKFYDLSPFLQLSLGANNAGPIGRFFVGTEYSPHQSYSLIFGIDGSAMRYNFQNVDYTSQKYGIQFGASFKF